MSLGKRLEDAKKAIDSNKTYSAVEAIELLKSLRGVKFDPTVEVAFNLNVDPKQSDQVVRGAVVLPNGIGKQIRVAVIANEKKAEEAKRAGADLVGGDDIIEDIKAGKIDFDRCIATPDMMPKLAAVGRILGPRGLMPNPKLGTVTDDVTTAVNNAKLGQVDFKTDKAGIVHAPLGKLSFDAEKIKQNLSVLVDAVQKLKPKAVKASYVKGVYLSATMYPSVKIIVNDLG